MRVISISIAMVLAVLVSACSGMSDRIKTADEYSEQVGAYLAKDKVEFAEEELEEMVLYYPVADQTQAMQIKMMEAYYRAGRMDDATKSAKQFARMFSRHDDIDYVYYLSGLANFDRGMSALEDEEPNVSYAQTAVDSFSALLRCCAESPFAEESEQKVASLETLIAEYELELMRDELRQGNRAAGVAKGTYIIGVYPETKSAEHAKALLSSIDEGNETRLQALLKVYETEPVVASALKPDEVVTADGTGTVASKFAENSSDSVAAIPLEESIDAYVNDREPLANNMTPGEVDTSFAMGGAIETANVSTVLENGVPADTAIHHPTEEEIESVSSSGRYTIQLASARKQRTLEKQMLELGVEGDVTYYSRDVNGEQWVSAFYSGYSDRNAALGALSDVRRFTGIPDAWVREFPPASSRLAKRSAQPKHVVAKANVGSTAVPDDEGASHFARTMQEEIKARADVKSDRKYAIQIASAKNLEALKKEMQEISMAGKVDYHRRTIKDTVYYSALYGGYSSMKAASADLSNLKQQLNREGLWVRKVSDSQAVE